MNKRCIKKFIKKRKTKTYLNVRRKVLIEIAINKLKAKGNELTDTDIIYIIDSRKMNLKHPKKIQVFENCYPTQIISGY